MSTAAVSLLDYVRAGRPSASKLFLDGCWLCFLFVLQTVGSHVEKRLWIFIALNYMT